MKYHLKNMTKKSPWKIDKRLRLHPKIIKGSQSWNSARKILAIPERRSGCTYKRPFYGLKKKKQSII